MSIQEKLDDLQPYVLGIKNYKGIQIVEVKFEKQWSLFKDDNFRIIPDDNDSTQLYIVPNVEGISVDDTLDYVKRIINYNIEQQRKHELLKEKVEELKEVFKKNSYEDLKKMEFRIGNEDYFENLVGDQRDLNDEGAVSTDELELDEDNEKVEETNNEGKDPSTDNNKSERTNTTNTKTNKSNKKTKKSTKNEKKKKEQPPEQTHGDNGRTEHEHKTDKVPGGKVELPSDEQDLHQAASDIAQGNVKPELEEHGAPNSGECNHGPDETCPNCIDKKDL